jgi:hypothetical protein
MTTTIGLLGVPSAMLGGLCLVVAAIYTVIRPSPAQAATTRQSVPQLTLRWAHAAVWLLLAGSSCLRTVDWTDTARVANVLALLALAVYAIFSCHSVGEPTMPPVTAT